MTYFTGPWDDDMVHFMVHGVNNPLDPRSFGHLMNKRINGLVNNEITHDLCRTNKSRLGIPNLNLVVSRQCKLPRGTLYILKHEASADIVTDIVIKTIQFTCF